jgi:hypothetical protein
MRLAENNSAWALLACTWNPIKELALQGFKKKMSGKSCKHQNLDDVKMFKWGIEMGQKRGIIFPLQSMYTNYGVLWLL